MSDPNSKDLPWGQVDIPTRSALVVIDAQTGFEGPHTRHVSAHISSLLEDRASDFKIVVATKFVNPPESNFRELIDWHALSGPPSTDLFDAVESRADRIVVKHTYGAIQPLRDVLTEAQVLDVFICGIDTDVCVLQNAAGLFDLGFKVRVLVDATGTNGGPTAQQAAIPLLRRTIGGPQVIELDV